MESQSTGFWAAFRLVSGKIGAFFGMALKGLLATALVIELILLAHVVAYEAKLVEIPLPPESVALSKEKKADDCAPQVLTQNGSAPTNKRDLVKDFTAGGDGKLAAWSPCVHYRAGFVRTDERSRLIAGSDPTPTANSEHTLLIVAVSGGGKRSAAFGYGVFKALRAAKITLPDDKGGKTQSNLLDQTDVISGASGGALPGAFYTLHGDNLFLPRMTKNTDWFWSQGCGFEDFLYEDTESRLWNQYRLPWKWGWVTTDDYGTNDVMAEHLAERLFKKPGERFSYDPTKPAVSNSGDESYCPQEFKDEDERANGAIYADLYDLGPPYFLAQTTEVTRGFSFPITQEGFDLICSDVSQFPLAWGVAGSMGFPVVLSQISLKNNHRKVEAGSTATDEAEVDCKPYLAPARLRMVLDLYEHCSPIESHLDAWSTPKSTDEIGLFRSSVQFDSIVSCYARSKDAQYVHLADGGVTDNFALNGLVDWFYSNQSGPPLWYLLHTTRKVEVLVVDGQRDADKSLSLKSSGPNMKGAFEGIMTNTVDQANMSSFSGLRDTLGEFDTLLRVRDLMVLEKGFALYKPSGEDKGSVGNFEAYLQAKASKGEKPQFESLFNCYQAKIKLKHYPETIPKGGEHSEKTPQEKYIEKTVAEKPCSEMKVENSADVEFLQVFRRAIVMKWGSAFGHSTFPTWNKVIGNIYGSISDFDKPVNTEDWTLMESKTHIDQETFLARYRILAAKLDLVSKYLGPESDHVDIKKLSIADDCNPGRRQTLLASGFGLYLPEDVIDDAIAAGQEVAERHLRPVLSFLLGEARADPPECEAWVAGDTVRTGGEAATPTISGTQ